MPTREQLDAMRENIHTLLATCPAPEPDGSEDDPNMAVYSYAWQESWLDLDAQLRWVPCGEAMPTEAREYECCVEGSLRQIWILQWVATMRRWWSRRGEVWVDPVYVTHWRPWPGWPGEEAEK
jgi:hypothetical protein